MAYTQLTMSPAAIELARSFGASGLQIGILGALPTGMLFMQFFSAYVANHLTYRRRLWMGVSLVQRLLLLPIAVGPLLFPDVSNAVWAWLLILLTAGSHALLHFGSPLWMSWMGDYLPRDGLSRYWGVRHLWMQWSAVISLLAGAFFLKYSGLPVQPGFGILIGVGAVLGLIDVVIFLKVEEPAVAPVPEPKLSTVLRAPFQHPDFRSFIMYGCFWHFAAMVGAPFISLFLLGEIGLSLFELLMLWALSWVGGAVFAARLGRLAESHGNRPVLILGTLFKTLNMIALIIVPLVPVPAFWFLVPVFMVDALLNAAIVIASNGFMLKNSPSVNRSMYIAAGTALAGMVGGITSIVAGFVLDCIGDWTVQVGALEWGGFQTLFFLSILMRLIAVFFARAVREAEGTRTGAVMISLIGATPLRMIRFPVGLYRSARLRPDSEMSGVVKDVSKTSP